MTHTITEPRSRTYVVTWRTYARGRFAVDHEWVTSDHAAAVAFAEMLRSPAFSGASRVMVDGREVR